MPSKIPCPSCGARNATPTDRGDIEMTCATCGLRWVQGGKQEPRQAPMGLGRLLRQVKNVVTGSSVHVFYDVHTPASLGAPFDMTLHLRVGDLPVEHKGVYVELRAQETIELPWNKFAQSNPWVRPHLKDTARPRRAVTHEETTYCERWLVQAPGVLEAGAQHALERTLQLPRHGIPTFAGRHIGYVWALSAYVDTKGVSPKTGWQALHVSEG